MKEEVFISVDIEADGPIPGDYSMSSLGAVVVDAPGRTFYRELRPISRRFDPVAAKVAGLDRAKLVAEGADPATAMADLARWVREATGPDRRAVFVGWNASFDWMWVNWYFVHFTGANPFGISGLDLKAYYMAALGVARWAETTRRMLDPRFVSSLPHTHHALDDAREQAEVFVKLRDHVAAQRR